MSDRNSTLPLFTNISVTRKLQILTLLFIVITTSLVSYTVVSVNQQKDDGLVINIAGRQRMLTQKLTKEFLLMTQAATQKDSKVDLSASRRPRSCLMSR